MRLVPTYVIQTSLKLFQPIGRAFALVQPASDRAVLTPEPVKTTEQVEVIKVSGSPHCLL